MLKRIAAAFLSVGALLGSTLCVNAAEADTNNAANMAIKLGDADNNGAVNAVDASIILSNYARYSTSTDKPSEYELITQDVNDDGLVNAVDASIVLSYYAYTSIGGTFTLPEYLKNPNEAPTAPVTTTTEPTTYKYSLEDITQSAEVFNYFAEKMNYDIFQGKSILTTRLNGEKLWLDGNKESKVALLLLNENEDFNTNVLKEVFKGYSDADITNGIHYLYINIAETELSAGTTTDFNKYVIDKDIGNYMNALQNAWKHAKETGDSSEMDRIIEDFLYTDIYDKQNYNAAACYYTYGIGATTVESELQHVCAACEDNGNFYGLQEMTENKIKELIK
jgi:hypothetical protein